MSNTSSLEITGNFLSHSFAELIAEIALSSLNGSLRCAAKGKKCIAYFRNGRLVFAVSNARSSRLFDMMLKRGRINEDDLQRIPNFQNDLEFSAFLQAANFLSPDDVKALFVEQIGAIVIDLMSWIEGEWTFSSLARVRDGLEFKIAVTQLLADFARVMPASVIMSRFRGPDETFRRIGGPREHIELSPNELRTFMSIGDEPMMARDLIPKVGIDESTAIRAVYMLWLIGCLKREDWHPAFTDISIASIKNARLELKQEAKMIAVKAADTAKGDGSADTTNDVEVISLDEYLARVETAQTFYDALGVDVKAEVSEIKRSYFALAKQFHPDHFHKAEAELQQRVQSAFTQISQAHETLKTEQLRELYDFKVRKELSEKQTSAGSNAADATSDGASYQQLQQAHQSFEHGFDLLHDGDTERAAVFLARAVHFAPENARYHAFYGKCLAVDAKKRHQAEAELQAAIRLDEREPEYRRMLAEFFISQKLFKRAEGELKRLLAIFPNDNEARELLQSIK